MMTKSNIHHRSMGRWEGGNELHRWEGRAVEWVIHRTLQWPRVIAGFGAEPKTEPEAMAKSVMSEETCQGGQQKKC